MNVQDHKQALPPGFRLDSYRVVRVLGAGGFGVTYLCEHGGLGVPVAVKEYLPNDIAVRAGNAVVPKSGADREGFAWGLGRFLDEARTLARFEHRNVVRVRDVFEVNGTAYIVMEYEDGEPLDRVLERTGTLTEAQIKRLLLPIVAGLRQVHAAGFLHRDVKPANIFIRRSDESPVLLDFGSARHALGRLSRSVTAIASSGYSPPEQYESNGQQGPWTDIYALSALCYRAIAGRAPVEAPRRQGQLLRGGEDPLPRLADIAGGHYSRALLEAVDRGLRVVEAERPGSLDEWWAELEGRAMGRAGASSGVVKTSGRKRMPDQGTAPRQTETRGAAPDPETMVRGMSVACFLIEGGIRKFGDYAKQMADELGEAFDFYRPYLRQFYEGVRHDPNSTDWRAEMTPPAELDALESSGSMDMLFDRVAQSAAERAVQAEAQAAMVQSEVVPRRRSVTGTASLLFGVTVSVFLYFAILVGPAAITMTWSGATEEPRGARPNGNAGNSTPQAMTPREFMLQQIAAEERDAARDVAKLPRHPRPEPSGNPATFGGEASAVASMTQREEADVHWLDRKLPDGTTLREELDERFPVRQENLPQKVARNLHDAADGLDKLADSVPVAPKQKGTYGVFQDVAEVLGHLSALLLSPGPGLLGLGAVGLLL